jgi:hypothetical protein
MRALAVAFALEALLAVGHFSAAGAHAALSRSWSSHRVPPLRLTLEYTEVISAYHGRASVYQDRASAC